MDWMWVERRVRDDGSSLIPKNFAAASNHDKTILLSTFATIVENACSLLCTHRAFGWGAFIPPGVILITDEDNCNASFTIIAGFDIVHESMLQLHSIFHICRLFVPFTRLAVALFGYVCVGSHRSVSVRCWNYGLRVCVGRCDCECVAGTSRGSFVNSCFASIFHLYSITHSNGLRWRARASERTRLHSSEN